MDEDDYFDETYFDVFGPFDVDCERLADGGRQAAVWAEANGCRSGLANAIGCYVFCLRRGETLTPWYVGMTIARGGFEIEAFAPHKLETYRRVLEDHPHQRRPQLLLFPLILRTSDRFGRGKTKKRVVLWLERMLMGFAYWQNPGIENVRDMKFLRNVTVNGLFGSPPPGRPKHAVAAARQVLFGD